MLKDQLGESSDEEEPQEETRADQEPPISVKDVTKEEESKIDVQKSELTNLLGDSDSDEDGVAEEKVEEGVEAELEENEHKDNVLDQILGKSIKKEKEEVKVRTSSTIEMRDSFRVQDSQKSYFVRTPNFVKIQTVPYSSDAYNMEHEKYLYDGATAIVRHREKSDASGLNGNGDGGLQMESNTRLVKWDDGSYQMVVGKAVFNAKLVKADNFYVYEQQKLMATSDEQTQKEKTVWECIGDTEGRLILQPSSLQSETHTRMSIHFASKYQKETKMVLQDYTELVEKPEKRLHQLAKEEDDLLRKEMKARTSIGDGRRSSYGMFGSQTRRPSMSQDYLNDNDEAQYDFYDEPAEKNVQKAQKTKETKKKERKEKSKPSRLEEEEDEEEDEEEEDEDEEEADEEEEEEDEDVEEDDDGDEDDEDDENNEKDKKRKKKDDRDKEKPKKKSKKEKKEKDKKKRKDRVIDDSADEEDEDVGVRGGSQDNEEDKPTIAQKATVRDDTNEMDEDEEDELAAVPAAAAVQRKKRAIIDSDED